MTLHTRIKDKMKELHLSKAELSRKTNIPYSTIDNWFKRNSNPSSETIKILADTLNTTTTWLLTGKNSEQEELPEEQQQLLNYFNQCNQEGKNRIMEQAEFIAAKYPKKGELLESKIG